MKSYYATALLFIPLAATIEAFTQSPNYFAGFAAGSNNTTGAFNTFVGANAGQFNTSGRYNSAYGFQSSRLNKTANYITSFGYNAGYSNTTSYNIFFGVYAGYSNSSGAYNSFLGSYAGYNTNNGSNNVFLGYNAGYYNTSGSYNNFIGNKSGQSNTIGSDNTLIGYFAGYLNSSGAWNTFIGNYSGRNNSTGYSNTFAGYTAGYNNTSGRNNSIFGRRAGYNNKTGIYNAMVGSDAGYSNTTGKMNTFIGAEAGYLNTTGEYNSFFGEFAGGTNKTGSGNIAIGYYSGFGIDSLKNSTAIGFRSMVSRSNAMVLGSVSGYNGATVNTNVGVGTTNPAYQFHVNGKAAKPGGGDWIAASDKRLKTNIRDFEDGIEILKQVHPVKFYYNGKAGLPVNKEYVGIIAQEMQLLAPYTIGEFIVNDINGKSETYLDYDGTALTFILVNAVKQQHERLELLENELNELKQILAHLQPDISSSPNKLWQNIPNPSHNSTTIRYSIDPNAATAFIRIFSSSGQEIRNYNLSGRSQGELNMSVTNLSPGMYVYSLFVDNKKVDSKKLTIKNN